MAEMKRGNSEPDVRESKRSRQALVVVPYDSEWPRRFGEILGMIQRTIPGTYHSVEHVGSTSVPGLWAKPILDIDIVMRDGMFEGIKRGLESLGYVHEGDKGIPGRDAFDLRDEGLQRTLAEHHLYVVQTESVALQDHRLFRDFMTVHPEWIERLNGHKQVLARRFQEDRQAYQEAKAPMVEEIIALARSELAQT